MELKCEPSIEYLETRNYCKSLYNNNSLCTICLVDEIEDGKHWDRNQTKCGHIFHSRCLRRWCVAKNCMNCPFCGDIPEIDSNKWCYACSKFGHELFTPKCSAYQEVYGNKGRRRRR